MLSKRLSKITPSVTVGINSKVKELKSNGVEVINLSTVSYTHLDVYKRQATYIAALTPLTYQPGSLPGILTLRWEILS